MSCASTTQSPARKVQVLEQAASLFKRNGYKATSMRQLAGELGIEAASLYNHISSKDDLLKSICACIAQQFLNHLAQLKTSKLSPAEKIASIVQFHIEMHLTRFNDIYVANRDWKHLNEPYRSEYLEIRRNYEKSLARIIAAGIRQKQFKPVNPHMAVITLLSAIGGLEHWQHNKHFSTAKHAAADLTNLLLHGLTLA